VIPTKPEEHPLSAAIMSLRAKYGRPELSKADLRSFSHTLIVTGGKNSKAKRKPTHDRTVAELRQVARQASDLHATLAALHEPAASVFRNLAGVKRILHILTVVARAAAAAPPERVAKPRRSSPAEKFALDAAYVFLMVTGRKPTLINTDGEKVHGPYVEFLRSVFAARGVPLKSLESSAKYGKRAMENNSK
jgi:hypothetical protein